MDESKLWGVSVRGWLTFIALITVCWLSIISKKVDEPLYTLVNVMVGFYFGQKLNGKPEAKPNA